MAENHRATKAEEQLGVADREPAEGQPKEENLAEVKAAEKSKYFLTSTIQIFKNMKRTLLVIAFALVAFMCYCQPAPTTEEEYNYVTKGYATQLSQGLDMKKGYSFKDHGEVVAGNYTFTFKILMRDVKKEMAALLVVAKSGVSGNSYYLCIPHGNPDLTKKYNESINNWDAAILLAYSRTLSSYLIDASVGAK